MGGFFDDGRFVGTNEASGDSGTIGLVSSLLGAASVAYPVAGLIREIIGVCQAARECWNTWTREGVDSRNPLSLAPRLLRAAAEAGPTVCVIDRADQANGGWWGDVILALAQEIATGLPLFLVISVDGMPHEAGPEDAGNTEVSYASRRLLERGLADLHNLAPVTNAVVEEWIGAVTPRVVDGLIDVAGGRARWIADLWADWRRREVVVKPDEVRPQREDIWDFAADSEDLALAPINDLVRRRLVESLGASADLQEREEALELLAVASLEGHRFTAEAVAAALDRDRDEVIDELDEKLSADDAHPLGLVTELGARTVADRHGSRDLWRYGFRTRLDWLTLRRYGLTEVERATRSAALADALETVYGEERRLAAGTIARLWRVAGHPELAAPYDLMVDVGMHDDVLIWRAEQILERSFEGEATTERALATDVLIAAVGVVRHRGPYQLGIDMTTRAIELAQADTARAEALAWRAEFLSETGDADGARSDCLEALGLYRGAFDQEGEASALLTLAKVEVHLDPGEATRLLERALVLGTAPGLRSTSLYTMAQACLAQEQEPDDWERARALLQEALAIQRADHDRNGEAASLTMLGFICTEHDLDRAAARAHYEQALEIARQVGDRLAEAGARSRLVLFMRLDRDDEAAAREFDSLIALSSEIGDRRIEAQMRAHLGLMLMQHGDTDNGRSELETALDTQQRLGDEEGAAYTREWLEGFAADK